MKTITLKLAGPLQSWGSNSRFRLRNTEKFPTKSGVIGLIASALGIQRNESLAELVELEYAVRIDQPGHLLRDYQTAIDWKATSSKARDPKLSTRYYLMDAVFVVAIRGKEDLIEKVFQALHSPAYPLYLGRRSCPAGYDLVLEKSQDATVEALTKTPWQASEHYRKSENKEAFLPIYRDAKPGEDGDRIQDMPVSYSQENRVYEWRHYVEEQPLKVNNPQGREANELFFKEVLNA